MVGGMKIKFDDFALTKTRFRLQDYNSDTILPKGMDFKHLDVSNINLTAENGTVVGDSIITKITHLSAKERSGFELLNLTTQARVSTTDITLDKLNLKTPNSEVKDYLSFRFTAYHDFKDFMNAMRIKADFTNSKISLKDLNYFVRKLDKVEHNRFTINGEIDGRINNLKGRAIEIRGGTAHFLKEIFTRAACRIFMKHR